MEKKRPFELTPEQKAVERAVLPAFRRLAQDIPYPATIRGYGLNEEGMLEAPGISWEDKFGIEKEIRALGGLDGMVMTALAVSTTIEAQADGTELITEKFRWLPDQPVTISRLDAAVVSGKMYAQLEAITPSRIYEVHTHRRTPPEK